MNNENIEYDDMPMTLNNNVIMDVMESSKDYRKGRIKYILTRIFDFFSTIISFVVITIVGLLFGSFYVEAGCPDLTKCKIERKKHRKRN